MSACQCVNSSSIPVLSQAVSLIAKGYPRGGKQLIGPFKSLFGPAEAAGWFGARGVSLKTERDGRMFPVTDDSQTIIDCLEGTSNYSSRYPFLVSSCRIVLVPAYEVPGTWYIRSTVVARVSLSP